MGVGEWFRGCKREWRISAAAWRSNRSCSWRSCAQPSSAGDTAANACCPAIIPWAPTPRPPPPPPPHPPIYQWQHGSAAARGIRQASSSHQVRLPETATAQLQRNLHHPASNPSASQPKSNPKPVHALPAHRSDCSSGTSGGDLGPFARGQVSATTLPPSVPAPQLSG